MAARNRRVPILVDRRRTFEYRTSGGRRDLLHSEFAEAAVTAIDRGGGADGVVDAVKAKADATLKDPRKITAWESEAWTRILRLAIENPGEAIRYAQWHLDRLRPREQEEDACQESEPEQ